MDTVTHGIAGSIFARTLTGRMGARAALLFGLVAAMLPDVDILLVGDRISYLRNHRGWSHSFFLMPALALGVALVARLIFRHARLFGLWLFSAVGIVSHILFDWITSFGTMFWIPLSRARHSLDWVFILDPIFTLIVSVALLAAAIFRSKGRLVSAAGAAALLAYIGACGVLHARSLRAWIRLDSPPPGARVAVLPQLLSPFRWLGLSDHQGEIHAAFFDVGPFARGRANPRPPRGWSEVLSSLSDFYPPPESAQIRRFPKAPESAPLAVARALPDVLAYLDFARFPLASVEKQPDGGTVVIFQDLRFLPWFTGPWERRGLGSFRRQPFVYRVRLDPASRPVEHGFVKGESTVDDD
jgi:membrane-bound metal-dependent hydrolase YbcI (DUF457 family)